AAALLAVAAVRGIVASGDENHGQFAAAITDNAKSKPRSEHGAIVHGSSGATNGGARLSPTATTPVFTRAQGTFAQVPTPTPARHQDYQADLRVRVDDLDTLGRRTAQAMRVTRDLGGYVASVQQSTSKG